MKKQPRYIWISVFAFAILSLSTGRCISKYEKKHNISAFDSKSLGRKANNNFILLGMGFIGIPMTLFMMWSDSVGRYFGRDSSWVMVFNIFAFVFLYFSGVYVTYKHVQWREKNISHMLKPKQEEDSDSSDSN